MGSLGIHRVRRDLRSLHLYKTPFWEATPRETDMFTWDCLVKPHEHSRYGGQEIRVLLSLGLDWPINEPTITITSSVNHPCISSQGRLELFNGEWSPAFNVGIIMLYLTALFNDFDETRERQIERTGVFKHELVHLVHRMTELLI